MFELNVKLHSSQPAMIMKDDLAGEDGIILEETVCLVLRHVLWDVCVRVSDSCTWNCTGSERPTLCYLPAHHVIQVIYLPILDVAS